MNELVQISPLSVLLGGDYRGKITVAKLRRDQGCDVLPFVGLGAYEGLHELVMFNNEFYLFDENGDGRVAVDEDKIAFVQILTTFKEPLLLLRSSMDFENIKSLQDFLLESFICDRKGSFWGFALQVEKIESARFRSFPKQNSEYSTPKPIKELVSKSWCDSNIKFANIVVIYSPEWCGGMSSEGFHFHIVHFCGDDGCRGGHVVDLSIRNSKVDISAKEIQRMHVSW